MKASGTLLTHRLVNKESTFYVHFLLSVNAFFFFFAQSMHVLSVLNTGQASVWWRSGVPNTGTFRFQCSIPNVHSTLNKVPDPYLYRYSL